jgi:hypothetical protein
MMQLALFKDDAPLEQFIFIRSHAPRSRAGAERGNKVE